MLWILSWLLWVTIKDDNEFHDSFFFAHQSQLGGGRVYQQGSIYDTGATDFTDKNPLVLYFGNAINILRGQELYIISFYHYGKIHHIKV